MDSKPRVVILGGGFGGLSAARALADAPVQITLLDRRNHHLFQPLLYQVATAALSAPDIAAPIRKVLSDQPNVRVLLAEARRIDPERRVVELDEGSVPYDYLVVAAGCVNHYFGNDAWEAHAPGLKTLDDALEIRSRVLLAYEHAERDDHVRRREAWLTFVVVGGGPTGVEMAGALAEIARHTLAKDFKSINPTMARVVLIEGGERLLPGFSPELSRRTAEQLSYLGVELRLNARVTAIDAEGVQLGADRIHSRTVVWAAGVKAASIAATLGAPMDRAGRVLVEADLSVPARREVFVIGDLAFRVQDGAPIPGVAQAALQGGQHAARCVLADLEKRERAPFRYIDKGSMATIGRSKAVAAVGKMEFSGQLAWMLWAFIHVVFLIDFRNRLAVMFEWAWAYFSWRRSARVILTDRRNL